MDRILEELLKDPRISFAELGRALGISDTAARKRFKRLVSKGVMKPGLLVDPGRFHLAQIKVMKETDSVAERFEHCPRVLLMARIETGELVIWFMAEDEKTLRYEVERHFQGAIVDMHAEVISPNFLPMRQKPEIPKNRTPCGEFCKECDFLKKGCSGCPSTYFKASSTRPGSR